MNDKEKAPTGAATSAGAKAERAAGLATNSYNHFNMTAADRQDCFSGLLHTGAENALTAAEIAQIAGCRARDVTRSFQKARSGGTAICADGNGYFVPKDAAEGAYSAPQTFGLMRFGKQGTGWKSLWVI